MTIATKDDYCCSGRIATLLAFAFLPFSAFADTDTACLNDCTTKGNGYSYCQHVCSSPSSNSSTVDTSIYGRLNTKPLDVGAMAEQAERVRQMRLQNDAEQQRQADQQQSRIDPPTQPQLSPEAKRFAEAIKYRRYKWPDFDETIFAKDLIVSQDMMGLMAESRYAADIAYYLGKHKDISAQISRLPLPEAAARIKAIENSVVAEAEHSQ